MPDHNEYHLCFLRSAHRALAHVATQPGSELSPASQKVYASIFTGFCRYLPSHWSGGRPSNKLSPTAPTSAKNLCIPAFSRERYYPLQGPRDFFNVAAGLALETSPIGSIPS